MAYRHIKIPTTGEKITVTNGKMQVPDQPIIGYVEGDGIGPDITKACLRIWDAAIEKAYGKLESELQRLAESTGLSLHLKRTEPRGPRAELLPYSIDVVCLDQSGIVAGLSGFCASRGIDIAEVSTRTYPAAHTGAQMFAVQMIINVPPRLQLAHLREEFMDYCDAQNLDAILEPVKS